MSPMIPAYRKCTDGRCIPRIHTYQSTTQEERESGALFGLTKDADVVLLNDGIGYQSIQFFRSPSIVRDESRRLTVVLYLYECEYHISCQSLSHHFRTMRIACNAQGGNCNSGWPVSSLWVGRTVISEDHFRTIATAQEDSYSFSI